MTTEPADRGKKGRNWAGQISQTKKRGKKWKLSQPHCKVTGKKGDFQKAIPLLQRREREEKRGGGDCRRRLLAKGGKKYVAVMLSLFKKEKRIERGIAKVAK